MKAYEQHFRNHLAAHGTDAHGVCLLGHLVRVGGRDAVLRFIDHKQCLAKQAPRGKAA